MQSKVNIFHSLQHASDSEEENDTQNSKSKKVAEKKEQRAQRDEKKNQAATKQAVVTGGGEPKESHGKNKAPYKDKGVTSEPHPMDRHSGRNNQAYGERPKKQGAGKGNFGNYKEDKKATADDENKEGGETTDETAQEKVEEAPTGITLAEYYQTRQQAQNEPQINEAKAKITSEQLTKELGMATALKTKQQQQIDDKKVGRKKDRLDVNHHAAINSDNANLLNFRTGFVEKEYRQRGEGDVNAGPRTRGPRTGGPKEDNKQEETQPQATEGQTGETQQAEGVTAEGTTAEGQTTATTETQGTQGNQGNQSRPRNEGQRGGRGGRGGYRGGHQGERQQGDRPQGDRPPRKQQGGQAQLNFDDSAFPKLG